MKIRRFVPLLGALGLGLLFGFWARGCFVEAPSPEPSPAESAAAEDAATEWTCSMHPQFRLPEPVPCPICAMDLIPVEAGEGGPLRRIAFDRDQRARLNLRTAPVVRREARRNVRLTGKIDYDETTLSAVTSRVPGRIDRLFVDYTGLPIRAGDHVAELYSPELFAAQEEFLQASRAAARSESGSDSMQRTAGATLRAARRKLELLGLSEEQIAGIEERGSPSEHLTLYAPNGGIVLSRDAKEGMYVETGTRICTVVDLSVVWVVLDAYESDLAWLRYGQEVSFTTLAWPGRRFEGTLSYIDSVVDPVTRTIKVRVNAPNQGGELKPGMFVEADVLAASSGSGRVIEPSLQEKWICPMHPEVIGEGPEPCRTCGMPLEPARSLGYRSPDADAEAPLLIPASAALLTGRRAIVYVEVPGEDRSTFEGREVVLGPRAGGEYLVLGGLEEGERVVVEGNFKIDSALQLRARPSMMGPDAGLEVIGEPSEAGRFALDRVERLARRLERAIESEDLAAAGLVFERLGETLRETDGGAFGADGLPVWEEIAMRLAGDAILGAAAVDLEEAREAQDAVASNVERLRIYLGSRPPEELPEPFELTEPERFRARVAEVWKSYEELRARLAGDDPPGAVEALGPLSEALRRLRGTGEPQEELVALLGELEAAHAAMARAAGIEELRFPFSDFSEALIEIATRGGTGLEEKLFIVRCPMAFDDTGARWVQSVPEVMNPYFGSRMYACGSVVGEIAADATGGDDER